MCAPNSSPNHWIFLQFSPLVALVLFAIGGLPAQISGWALRLPVHSQTEVPTREIRETLWTPWTPPGGGILATTCDPWDDPPTKLMIHKRIYIYNYYIIYIYGNPTKTYKKHDVKHDWSSAIHLSVVGKNKANGQGKWQPSLTSRQL